MRTEVDFLQTAELDCPYCGETITLEVDCSVSRQEYIEDCQVCCRPMVLGAVAEQGVLVSVTVRTEDD